MFFSKYFFSNRFFIPLCLRTEIETGNTSEIDWHCFIIKDWNETKE